jgi:hypothetical protein
MSWTFYSSNGEALVQHAESEAVQSEMEAETAVAKFVPPDLIKYSPGVSKAWLFTTYSGGAPQITLGHGISSLGDDGTGHIQVNFSTNFSSAAYAAVVTTDGNDSIERAAYTETTHAVGAIDYFQVNITDDSNVDGASSLICFGDHA